MGDFLAGVVITSLLWIFLSIGIHHNKINMGKEMIYEHACKVKCGKEYLSLQDNNNLCICKNGITYKRDLNKLYK